MSYWQLGQKVVGQAISTLSQTNRKFVGNIPQLASCFDEVVINGAKNEDKIKILTLKDEAGRILRKVTAKTENEITTRNSKMYQYNESGTDYLILGRQTENGKLVCKQQQTIGHEDGIVGKTLLRKQIGLDGSAHCDNMIGSFSKTFKRILKFDYSRTPQGYIKDNVSITEAPVGMPAPFVDYIKPYLPLYTNMNKNECVKDLLQIHATKRRLNNLPIVKTQKDRIAIGTSKSASGTVDFWQILFQDGRAVDFTFDVPRVKICTESPKHLIADSVAHETDHLKRLIGSMDLKDIKRGAKTSEVKAWFSQACKHNQPDNPNPIRKQRSDEYMKSFMTEILNPDLPIAEYQNLIFERAARHAGKKAQNRLYDTFRKLYRVFPHTAIDVIMA